MIPDAVVRGHADIAGCGAARRCVPADLTRPAVLGRNPGAYPGAVTNEPTAELPAQRAGTAAPGWARRADPGAPAPSTPSSTAPSTSPSTAPSTASSAGASGSDESARSSAGAAVTSPTGLAGPASAVPPAGDPTPRPRARRWPVALLAVLLLAALGAAGYLYATTTAYADRVAWTEDQARRIGTELVTTRGELDGVRGELEGVRAQLATAQERITALADEKAQIGDDREAQAQLLDYQARVSEAAGTVASALDRCVQGQDQLIEYLGDAGSYDPAQLAQFGQDVERLCQSASEANVALQAELADR
jgi:hypothetical protein